MGEAARKGNTPSYGGWRWPPKQLCLYIHVPTHFSPSIFFEGNRSCEGLNENNEVVYKFTDSGYWLVWRWRLLDGQWLIEKSHGSVNLDKNNKIGISKTQTTQIHFKSFSSSDFSLENFFGKSVSKQQK